MRKAWASRLKVILSIVAILLAAPAQGQPRRPEWRGLLASSGLEGQPVKGVYFFAGERGANDVTYTTHPLDPRDGWWNSDPTTRTWVIDRMVRANVNTVVMSYWSNMPQWSPMVLGPDSLSGLLEAVRGRQIVVIPAIEGGIDPDHPEIPHWELSREFPHAPAGVAPGLVERIGQLIDLFRGRMHLWARIYDRDGVPRYAVNLLHAASDVIESRPGNDTEDRQFAEGFEGVADQALFRYRIPIGFTLDTIGGRRYAAFPREAGPSLEQAPSVLAIQGFASEVFSGLVRSAPPCNLDDWRLCQPIDNNVDNLERLADWKRAAVHDWLATGVPVILDVSNGFDGRIVWKGKGAGFWGDNLNYTDDRWRNWMSELKGPGVKGIAFNTWNGYTEGYAAVPSVEHGSTVYNWLADLLEPPPSDCSHMHYVNGARTHRVYGAICEKWIRLGADRGFGAPVSEELPTPRGRMSHFTDGKAIFWSATTGAHEVHGLIARTYQEAGADGSCLGLPVSDEEAAGDGRVCHFERGRIDWRPGEQRGRITCR